jgi:hypothetical protein
MLHEEVVVKLGFGGEKEIAQGAAERIDDDDRR